MKPYYQHDGITIYVEDARVILPDLAAGLIVTDPPYNVGYNYEGYPDHLTGEEYQLLLRTTIRPPAIIIHYPEPMFELARFLGVPKKVVAWIYNANTPRQWRSVA